MSLLTNLYVVLFCSIVLQVESSYITPSLQNVADKIKSDVERQATVAATKARQAAQKVMSSLSETIEASETWLHQEMDKQLLSMSNDSCKPDEKAVQGEAHASLWVCLQIARVVTDGTDIAAKGVGVSADILDTADNFLQSLTACIIGPESSPSQLAACYLSAIGTIASGLAQNIEEVEHYINVVKRDVSDIHAAVKLCGQQTYSESVQSMKRQRDNCQQKNPQNVTQNKHKV